MYRIRGVASKLSAPGTLAARAQSAHVMATPLPAASFWPSRLADMAVRNRARSRALWQCGRRQAAPRYIASAYGCPVATLLAMTPFSPPWRPRRH